MRIVRDTVLVLVALTIAFALVVGGVLFRANREVQGELARLQQAGKPTTTKEVLERAIQASPSTVSEPADYRALAELTIPEELTKDEPWSEQQRQQVREFLEQHRGMLDTLRKGGYNLGFSHRMASESSNGASAPPEKSFKAAREYSKAALLLRFESQLAMLEGRTDDAVAAIAARFALARNAGTDVPLLIGAGMQAALDAQINTDLQTLLSACSLVNTQLEQLQRETDQLDYPATLARAIDGERALVSDFFDYNEQLTSGPAAWTSDIFHRNTMRDFSEAEEILLQTPESQRAYATLPSESSSLLQRVLPLHLTRDAIRPIVGISLHGAAAARAAESGPAVERYRLAEGRLPDSLEQTVPRFLDAVPMDPCDGAPLRYRQENGGFVVYSVGLDGVDNGGAEGQMYNSSAPSDIFFRVTPQQKTLDSGGNA